MTNGYGITQKNKTMDREKVEKEISPSKQYSIPQPIVIKEYAKIFLVIAVETANWIVLQSQEQLTFFNLLKENTIEQALSKFKGCVKEAEYVVMQLEARDFENQEVMLKSDATVMHIALTSACNMRCPHCYMYAGKKQDDEMTTEEILSLIANFKKYGGKHLVLTGGEICTREDLMLIISEANKLNLDVELLTNGTLWSDDMIEAVCNKVRRVQISIDGYNETVNAKIRGKNNFKKALDTVEKFLQHGTKVNVAITPFYDKEFLDNFSEYSNFAKNLMKKYRDFPFSVSFNGALLDGRELHLTDKEKANYQRIIRKITEESMDEKLDNSFVNFHRAKGIENNCSYGNISVNPNGDTFFCAAIPTTTPFANVKTMGYEAIDKISKMAIESSNVNNIEPCRNCELKYICGGDCRIQYFTDFKNCGNIESIAAHPKRVCDETTKNEFYELMISTNELLFV